MKRHLIYHVTPMGNYKENIDLLRKYFHIFNGETIAVVYQGENLIPADEVELPEFKKVFYLENNPQLRESPSLYFLLQELFYCAPDGIAFFGHTKGVTHTHDTPERKEAIRLWTRASYEKNLEDVEKIEELLKDYAMVGCFRQLADKFSNFPPGCPWCYAGTFFWFDVSRLWKQDWRSAVRWHRFGAEAFPGFAFPIEASACLIGEGSGTLYDLYNIRQILGDDYASE